jgi:hypothetical protein
LSIDWSLSNVLFAQARAGFVDEALGVAASLEEKLKNRAVALVAEAVANRGEIERARKIAGSISDASYQLRAFEACAEAQAASGNLREALEWALSREPIDTKANLLRSLASGVARRPRTNSKPRS